MKEVADLLNDPDQNLLSSREIKLVIEGTDDPIVREYIRLVVEKKTGLKIIEGSSSSVLTANVSYSEEKVGDAMSLDRWHTEPNGERVRPPVPEWGSDQHELEIVLTFRLVTPGDNQLYDESVRGRTLPASLDFSLPTEMQFRLASLFEAGQGLKLELPAIIWVNSEILDSDDAWIQDVTPDGKPLEDISIEVIPVNNGWFDDEPDLPLVR